MEKDAIIYVAGSETLIGSAILRELERQGYRRLVGKSGQEPCLTDPAGVEAFFREVSPEYVFAAAGRSGGIRANQAYPADLMIDNLLTECHLIHCAHRYGVKKLLYLGSSCCYPRHCAQPIREESLLTGPLEPTNESYAVAKIAGIKLCQAYRRQHGADFISGIPATAFGAGDHFGSEDSHVIPALITKCHEAKARGGRSVRLWGTGTPRREFIFADDLAEACLVAMNGYSEEEPINLGSGSALSIQKVAAVIGEVVGFRGDLEFDPSAPDGMPVKVLDSTKLRGMGWRPRFPFRKALEMTYEWYLKSSACFAISESSKEDEHGSKDGRPVWNGLHS